MRAQTPFPELLLRTVMAFLVIPLLGLAGFAALMLLALMLVVTVPLLLAAVPFVALLWKGGEDGDEAGWTWTPAPTAASAAE